MTTRQQDEIAYYRRRLAEEETRAEAATMIEVRPAHRELAALYRDMLRIHEDDQSRGHHHASRTIVDRLRLEEGNVHRPAIEPERSANADPRQTKRPAATARDTAPPQ